jgi:hypothetical protein
LIASGSKGAIEIRDGCQSQIFPETSQPSLESTTSSPNTAIGSFEPPSPWPLLPEALKSKLKPYRLPLGIGGKSRIFKGGSDWGDGGNGAGLKGATSAPWRLSEPPKFEPTEMEKNQMLFGLYQHHRETYFRQDELCTQSGIILPDGHRAIAMRLSENGPFHRVDSALDLFASFTKDQTGSDRLSAFVADSRNFIFDRGRPLGIESICQKSVLGPDLYSLVEPRKATGLWLEGSSPFTPDRVPGIVDETLSAKPFLINRDSNGGLDRRAYETYGALIACADGKLPMPGNQKLILKGGFESSGAYDISIDANTIHAKLHFGADRCRFEGDGFWVNPWTAVVPSPYGWAELHFDLENPRLKVFLKTTDESCIRSSQEKPLWLGRHLWRFDDVGGD